MKKLILNKIKILFTINLLFGCNLNTQKTMKYLMKLNTLNKMFTIRKSPKLIHTSTKSKFKNFKYPFLFSTLPIATYAYMEYNKNRYQKHISFNTHFVPNDQGTGAGGYENAKFRLFKILEDHIWGEQPDSFFLQEVPYKNEILDKMKELAEKNGYHFHYSLPYNLIPKLNCGDIWCLASFFKKETYPKILPLADSMILYTYTKDKNENPLLFVNMHIHPGERKELSESFGETIRFIMNKFGIDNEFLTILMSGDCNAFGDGSFARKDYLNNFMDSVKEIFPEESSYIGIPSEKHPSKVTFFPAPTDHLITSIYDICIELELETKVLSNIMDILNNNISKSDSIQKNMTTKLDKKLYNTILYLKSNLNLKKVADEIYNLKTIKNKKLFRNTLQLINLKNFEQLTDQQKLVIYVLKGLLQLVEIYNSPGKLDLVICGSNNPSFSVGKTKIKRPTISKEWFIENNPNIKNKEIANEKLSFLPIILTNYKGLRKVFQSNIDFIPKDDEVRLSDHDKVVFYFKQNKTYIGKIYSYLKKNFIEHKCRYFCLN